MQIPLAVPPNSLLKQREERDLDSPSYNHVRSPSSTYIREAHDPSELGLTTARSDCYVFPQSSNRYSARFCPTIRCTHPWQRNDTHASQLYANVTHCRSTHQPPGSRQYRSVGRCWDTPSNRHPSHSAAAWAIPTGSPTDADADTTIPTSQSQSAKRQHWWTSQSCTGWPRC